MTDEEPEGDNHDDDQFKNLHDQIDDSEKQLSCSTINFEELKILETLGKGVQGKAFMVFYKDQLACAK